MVFVIAFDLHFSLKVFFLFIVFFKPTKFLTNQLTEHSSFLIRRLFAWFDFSVNILLRSNTVFIITRHGLHGKPASYIYRSCYLLQQCGFAKLRFKIGQANFTLNDSRYYVSQKFDHILKILFWFHICRHHIPPDGTTAVALDEFFISESVLESSLPQEEQIMHEGISTSKVSASLLQGNMVPIII